MSERTNEFLSKLPLSQSVEACQIKSKWVEKYQAFYLEEHGQPIDKTKALDELNALLCLLNAVQRHINKNNHGQ